MLIKQKMNCFFSKIIQIFSWNSKANAPVYLFYLCINWLMRKIGHLNPKGSIGNQFKNFKSALTFTVLMSKFTFYRQDKGIFIWIVENKIYCETNKNTLSGGKEVLWKEISGKISLEGWNFPGEKFYRGEFRQGVIFI